MPNIFEVLYAGFLVVFACAVLGVGFGLIAAIGFKIIDFFNPPGH